MKKWLTAAAAAALAAAAAGAAIALKGGKGSEKASPKAEKASPKAAAKAPAKGGAKSKKKDDFAITDLKTGVYSFPSGYKDAKEIKVNIGYDGQQHAFNVVSEEYIADSGDSHVAIVSANDFGIQFEYAPYYAGEDFAALEKSVADNFKNFGHVKFDGVSGICYTNGGSYCMAFPTSSDNDYVLATVVLMGDDSEEEREKLRSNPEMIAIMNTVTIE